MNKVNKKGFTIVELVIVLAVIGILAGILIPTFANVIRKSQISADVQLAKNLNTVLATAAAEGRIPTSMYDVLYLENEAGYIIENLNPTNQDYYFAWDSANNKIVYLMDDLVTVYYPEEYRLDTSACWITVGSAEEAYKISSAGYNIALEKSIDGTIVLNNVVSVDTLGFKAGKLEFSESCQTATADTYVTLSGNIGEIKGNIGNANVSQSGSASTITLSGTASSSITVGGYVSNFSATGSAASVSSTGMIETVAATTTSNIENNGVVTTDATGRNVVQTNTADGNVVSIANKEGIQSIRDQLVSGKRTFSGETISLSNDINMSGIAFQPLSNHNRNKTLENKTKYDTSTWFQGTFDGAGYSIIGFSTDGFNLTGLNAGVNDTSVAFGNGKIIYSEAVYGLFGTAYNATFKNLTVNCSINMELDSAKQYVGDSLGGLIGFGYGAITIENCTITGSVRGYDSVGGFVGRFYGSKLTFKDCVNQATVTGVRKTGGFCGYTTGEIAFINCRNEGNVYCLGIERDKQLECKDNLEGKSDFSGYYRSSLAACTSNTDGSTNKNPIDSLEGFTNTGKAYVGEVEHSHLLF